MCITLDKALKSSVQFITLSFILSNFQCSKKWFLIQLESWGQDNREQGPQTACNEPNVSQK